MALTKLQYTENIKNYIANAKPDKAFAEFDQLFFYYPDEFLTKEVFLVKGSYGSLRKDETLGLIGSEEVETRRNKINKSLMDFCDMVLNPSLIINNNQIINQNLIVNQMVIVNNGIV